MPGAQLPDGGQVAVVGQHDADVRQGGLHQHRGDVAVGQGGVQGRQVVELHDPGGQVEVDGGTDVAGPGDVADGKAGRRDHVADRRSAAVAYRTAAVDQDVARRASVRPS